MARIFQRKHDKFFWIDFNDAQGRRHRRRVARQNAWPRKA